MSMELGRFAGRLLAGIYPSVARSIANLQRP
jgi:hypothetical protein